VANIPTEQKRNYETLPRGMVDAYKMCTLTFKGHLPKKNPARRKLVTKDLQNIQGHTTIYCGGVPGVVATTMEHRVVEACTTLPYRPVCEANDCPMPPQSCATVPPRKPNKGASSPLWNAFSLTNATKIVTDAKGQPCNYRLLLCQVSPCDAPHVWENTDTRDSSKRRAHLEKCHQVQWQSFRTFSEEEMQRFVTTGEKPERSNVADGAVTCAPCDPLQGTKVRGSMLEAFCFVLAGLSSQLGMNHYRQLVKTRHFTRGFHHRVSRTGQQRGPE
jgi:hypothetical protein